ncbi:PREDICTED: short-chain type dehydrogenase/reductase-like [Camelina sativa]|uniref:Short-chain type dehydrogenase/reductase-like n=1 Tax=Camelina sativa TaxID=90675 RepID=A0ABM0ZMK5_CAMSA|nr:PREDICTED: short-chain type dehydrogenase/reductase-like [Camelina sativa]
MATQPPLPLAGRVAIVTGSSRGIGRAIAIHLAELGARIVINYTSKAADAERAVAEINAFPVREEITGKGPRAIVVQANVSEPSQVKSMFDAAETAFESPVHILVNSAGILDPNHPSIADTSVEDFDRIFSVNTRGAFLCSKEAANRLKKGGGGRIILVTSSSIRSLRIGYGTYAASKAAVETMVKILAKELKGTGITANCVAPGPIATDMFYDGKTPELVEKIAAESPFARIGEAKDVVPLVGFLAGDGGEWVNGQIIPVNGGFV